MKKSLILALVLLPAVLFAQQDDSAPQKYALVIGNANYTGLSPLTNPINDANDISAVLYHLGFTVDKVLNGTLEQMEDAVLRLRENLSAAENSYGFFFYAGHGVQSGGENYLIPVNANIPGENALRNRAMSVQMVLDDLNDSRNALNVVVLDACRDNPFGWSRSGSRGLSIVTRQPADSIIVYATSAGQTASDGQGRNGLYTSQLINNLATPGIEVKDVFNRTGQDVAKLSKNQQIPATYSQFFGTAFLGETPQGWDPSMGQRPSATVIIGGSVKEPQPAKFWSVGASVGSALTAPWMIATAHGTVAPFKHSFLELGVDFGFVHDKPDVGYYSILPYGHLVFFYPVTENKIGVYAGLGGGLQIVSYQFKDDGVDYSDNIPVAAFTAGLNLFDMINISSTIRTNFSGLIVKMALGYTYRFN